MAYYAFLDIDNIVTEVIAGRNEYETVDGISDWEAYYGDFRGQKCVRTSYNNNIRKQYAGIGFTYDATGKTVTGGTVTTSGSYTVHTFTSSSSLVIS